MRKYYLLLFVSSLLATSCMKPYCERIDRRDKFIGITEFDEIVLGEGVTLANNYIGENKVKLNGSRESVKLIEVKVEDKILYIQKKDPASSMRCSVRADVEIDQLKKITMHHGGAINMDELVELDSLEIDMHDGSLRMTCNANYMNVKALCGAYITITGDVQNLNTKMTGGSEFSLLGHTINVKVLHLSEDSKLDVQYSSIDSLIVDEARRNAIIKINQANYIDAQLEGNSHVYYHIEPVLIIQDTIEGSSVSPFPSN